MTAGRQGATEQGGTIHVLFCADNNYLRHAAVAAVSLLSASGETPVVVHVMTTGPAPGDLERLEASLNPFARASLQIHRVVDDRLETAFVDRYLTREAYLRFLAPKVLPPEVGRVIYLDCDLVVLDDLVPLWSTDLGDHAVGAVAELDWSGGGAEIRLTRLGIPADHVYVNSGVLLLDLVRWRRERLAEKIFDFVAARGADLSYHDQDALNAVLWREIHHLDRRWNVQAMMYGRWYRRNMPADHRATRAARSRPAILHYTTASKPWNWRRPTRKRHLYYRFLDRTAWHRQVVAPEDLRYRFGRLALRAGLDPSLLPSIRNRPGR